MTIIKKNKLDNFDLLYLQYCHINYIYSFLRMPKNVLRTLVKNRLSFHHSQFILRKNANSQINDDSQELTPRLVLIMRHSVVDTFCWAILLYNLSQELPPHRKQACADSKRDSKMTEF
jgi:hypothetical protein